MKGSILWAHILHFIDVMSLNSQYLATPSSIAEKVQVFGGTQLEKKTNTWRVLEGFPKICQKVLHLYHERPCRNIKLQTDNISNQLKKHVNIFAHIVPPSA